MSKIFILFLIVFGIFASSVQGSTHLLESCVNVKIYNPISNETDEKCFRPPVTFVKVGSNYCAQVTVYAISPDGTCGEFSTPCDIPFDWEWVNSCDNPQIIETTSGIVIGGGEVFTSGPIDIIIERLGSTGQQHIIAETITVTPTTVTITFINEQGESVVTTTNTSRDSDFPTIINVVVANSENEFEEINIAPLPEEGIIVIESGRVTATTINDIFITNSILVIIDDGQLYPVDFLPEEALKIVEKHNMNSIEVDAIELTVQNGTPVYKISGTRSADLFFIIPITLDIVTFVNAQTGEIISEETPFWGIISKPKEDKVERKELANNDIFDEITKEANKIIREQLRKAR